MARAQRTQSQQMEEGFSSRDEDNEEKSCLFPCQPCAICPSLVLIWVPETWQKIQDFTHLMLVVGLSSCIVLIIHSILYIANRGSAVLVEPTWSDGRAIVVLFFAFPITIYSSRVISQYDERLQAKQKMVKKEKENLLNCYKGLLSDMDTLLSKSTESASGLAERSFESKRRDFQRFLDRLKLRFPAGQVVMETPEMVAQFRKFVLNWLRVFQECSIDPVVAPKLLVTQEDLESLSSIYEIASFVSDRLQTTEVKFITEQRKNDSNVLNSDKERLGQMSHGRNMIAITDGREQTSGSQVADGRQRSGSFVQQVGQGATPSRQCTWCTCGGVGVDCCKPSANPEGCPREFKCGCFELIVLSRQHLNLMFSFVLGIGTTALSTYLFLEFQRVNDESAMNFEMVVLVFMVLTIFSLVMILLKFEQIDVVQQLEREVRELKEQNEIVEANRKRMRDFWNKAQQLTELWLYRTVPRLDLCKELHSQLEDTQNDKELLTHMMAANKGLTDIEGRLGSLEDWKGEGLIKVEDKKAFGKIINEVCQEQDPDAVIQKIQELVRGKEMRNLMLHN